MKKNNIITISTIAIIILITAIVNLNKSQMTNLNSKNIVTLKHYLKENATNNDIINNLKNNLGASRVNDLLEKDLEYSKNQEYLKVESNKDLEISKYYSNLFEATIMEIKDPARIKMVSKPASSSTGLTLAEYISSQDGIAGINAGGFIDDGGKGNGGTPWGIVIKDGKLIYGFENEYTSVIGLNIDNTLVVEDMTGKQALDWGLTEAVTFGPALIKNYESVYTGGGVVNNLNPRTVIAQKSDGSILFVVIDGRQPSSFGARYSDVIDMLLTMDVKTAGNLDGGNSSEMIYDGQVINSTVSFYGGRALPSSFIVSKENQ